jgi:hypothetical protein
MAAPATLPPTAPLIASIMRLTMFIGLVSCFVHACLRLLVREWDGEKRDDGCLKWFGFCREMIDLPPRILISGLTSLEWLVRNARPHALRNMQLSGYLSRQKKTSKT